MSLTLNGAKLQSDKYATFDPGKSGATAEGKYAKKNKIDGLYFYEDSGQLEEKLPVGLSGVTAALELVENSTEKASPKIPQFELEVRVVWDFAGDSSCSDYIRYTSEDYEKVAFSNQDWWIKKKGYNSFLKKLSQLAGCELSGLSGF